MPHHRDDRLSRPGRLVLLAGLLLGCSLPATGEEFDNVPKHYFNENKFEIPFETRFARPVKQVMLHASTDGKVFRHVATASPKQERFFVYRDAAEGWHYFVVQVEDYNGNKTPARVDSSVVDLGVCVDLEKPTVSLKPVVPQEGTVAVEWKVKDNQRINAERLKLEYRTAGGSGAWTPLKIRQMNPAQYSWSPAAGEYDVRLTAFDLAGNSAEATTRVTSRGGSGTTRDDSPTETGDGPPVFHVPKKTFKLDYKIDNVGPSQVKTVEVWYTRDTKLWSQFEKKDAPADPKEGCELTVRSAGRWGFTLRPISGVGRASRPPNTLEQPQIWVEVDETPPVVRILGVTVGEGADTGTITVSWTATDQWLRKKPITIFYSENKESGWQPLKSGLENTGMATIPTSDIKPFEFYLKVEAIDEAGHKGHDQTRDTVKIDLNVPKALILKVTESSKPPP